MMEKQFVAPQGYLPTSNKVNRNLPSIIVVFDDINLRERWCGVIQTHPISELSEEITTKFNVHPMLLNTAGKTTMQILSGFSIASYNLTSKYKRIKIQGKSIDRSSSQPFM